MSIATMINSNSPAEFISELDFHDRYFGYIINKRKLETKTAKGNEKFVITVGKEGEIIADRKSVV